MTNYNQNRRLIFNQWFYNFLIFFIIIIPFLFSGCSKEAKEDIVLSLASTSLEIHSHSSGKDIYIVPKLTEEDAYKKPIINTNLPNPSLIKLYNFTVLIPKGWTINPNWPTDKFKCSLTATPTHDIPNEKTYIMVSARQQALKKTLEERLTDLKKLNKKGSKVYFNNWQGNRWLVVEYYSKYKDGEEKKVWFAFALVNGEEFVLTASTPKNSVSKYESQLKEIMKSITLHP